MMVYNTMSRMEPLHRWELPNDDNVGGMSSYIILTHDAIIGN